MVPVLLVLVLTVLWSVTGILTVVKTPVVLADVEGPEEGHRTEMEVVQNTIKTSFNI